MKTRSLDDGFDPFKDLPPAQPIAEKVTAENLQSLINSATAVEAKKVNVEVVSSEKNAVDLSANTTPTLSDEWIRQDLPSLCIPYDFREVYLRTVSIRGLSKLHSARVNDSFPILVDGLATCINVDIRLLTPEDFIFVMHWVRDNSYPMSPLKIKHKTRYGNVIEVNVRNSDLKITELNLTKEEYAKWYEKGFAAPTVRDAELITRNADNMDAEQEFMLETAQYIRPFDDDEEVDYSKYVSNKFARLDKMGPTVLKEIEEFKKLLKHGIEQKIEIEDTKFESKAAVAYLTSEIDKLRAKIDEIPEEYVEDASVTILLTVQEIQELEAERDLIQQAIDTGMNYKPKKEVVAVNLTATEFFP